MARMVQPLVRFIKEVQVLLVGEGVEDILVEAVHTVVAAVEAVVMLACRRLTSTIRVHVPVMD